MGHTRNCLSVLSPRDPEGKTKQLRQTNNIIKKKKKKEKRQNLDYLGYKDLMFQFLFNNKF